METLRDKTCFITGAASGIGKATALAAAAEGAQLFLTDIDAPRLEATVREIREAGGHVTLARAMDIADYEAVRDLADEIRTTWGAMDVVMNVAGISIWGAVENLTHQHWRQVVDINLMGPIHVIETFVADMIRAGKGGHLVNVSSAAGLFGLPWHAAYSAAKFGLRGISEVLRFDLEQHGIGVSLVCPGGVNTPLVDSIQIVGAKASQEALQKRKAHFRRRAVTPEQAAQAIIRGVLENEYLVFTSRDIQIGYWFQTKFGFLYEYTMRRLNKQLHQVIGSPRLPGETAEVRGT